VHGDPSDVASFTWTVDTQPPPAPTIASGPPPLTDSTVATFAFNESEADASLTCTLDAAAPAACQTSYSGLADGLHTLAVTATDPAGNAASSTPYTWTVDTQAPPPPTILTGPANPTADTDATFTFSDDADPTATFRCRLDGDAFAPCSSGITYSGLDDGNHTFRVVAVDPLGHVSDASRYTWAVDTVHPLVTITGKPPLVTNQTNAEFTFTSDTPANGYQCSLDGAQFSACSSPQPYPGLADGSHTFAVRTVSKGHTPGPATSYTWTVDTIPPHTTITSAPPSASNSAVAAFAFASTEAGSSFVCSLNSGGFTPCTSPQTYSGLGDGSYTFRVEAVDAAGNADPSAASYAWQVAGVGPGTKDLKPPANVTRLRRNVGYGRLQLRWLKPRDSDFDHVGIYVSTSKKTPPRKLVYSGRSQSYTDKHFKNGQYYRYLIVSYDHEKNASGGMPAPIAPGALMTAPRNGAVLHKAPKFRWSGVRGASFYNIQLYTHGEKVLSAWPAKARQLLTRSWRYRGHRYSLRPGVYVWYVWPGFGPRTKARYGQLLGYSSFRVR